MTIRQLDDDMGQQEKKRSRLLLAVGISNAQSPKGVVVTEATNPWRKWADQFASADSAGRGVVVMPDGASPKVAAATITRAMGMTQAGVLLLSVHGGSGAAGFSDEGMFDLAPGKAFRIGGRNSMLPGDPTNGKEGTRAHTHVFYDERIPNRALKGGFQESRKDHDEKSSSDTAKTRLANWRAYQDVCSAFKNAPIAGMFLLTCKVGGSSGFLKRVAQQWNTPIIAYTKEGDAPGQDTNVPLGEVMFPVSRSMVLIRP